MTMGHLFDKQYQKYNCLSYIKELYYWFLLETFIACRHAIYVLNLFTLPLTATRYTSYVYNYTDNALWEFFGGME